VQQMSTQRMSKLGEREPRSLVEWRLGQALGRVGVLSVNQVARRVPDTCGLVLVGIFQSLQSLISRNCTGGGH